MLVGRNIVKAAAVWSIEDGRSIKYFTYTWIPYKYETILGIHPVTESQAQMTLEEWIDPASKTWKDEEVRVLVSQE